MISFHPTGGVTPLFVPPPPPPFGTRVAIFPFCFQSNRFYQTGLLFLCNRAVPLLISFNAIQDVRSSFTPFFLPVQSLPQCQQAERFFPVTPNFSPALTLPFPYLSLFGVSQEFFFNFISLKPVFLFPLSMMSSPPALSNRRRRNYSFLF